MLKALKPFPDDRFHFFKILFKTNFRMTAMIVDVGLLAKKVVLNRSQLYNFSQIGLGVHKLYKHIYEHSGQH